MNIVCSLPWQNINIFYFSCLKRSGCYGDATRVFSHPLHDTSSCHIFTSSLREEFSRNYLRAEKIELLTWGEDIVTNSPHIRGPGESILKILSTSRAWLGAGAVLFLLSNINFSGNLESLWLSRTGQSNNLSSYTVLNSQLFLGNTWTDPVQRSFSWWMRANPLQRSGEFSFWNQT